MLGFAIKRKVCKLLGLPWPSTEAEMNYELQVSHYQNQMDCLVNNKAHAMSITVGNNNSGHIDVTIRTVSGDHVFKTLQPVECIELIHELAAACGCHIHVRPREDFASWRPWEREEHAQLNSELANQIGRHGELADVKLSVVEDTQDERVSNKK
tara:strand:- start:664 stop:1125 length:462 start_codon:yes stop_codon:yes gene_type:complete